MRSRNIYLIMLCLMTVLFYGCSGSGNGSNNDTIDPDSLVGGTGNEFFNEEDAQAADPLDMYRVADHESNILPGSVDHTLKMPIVRSQGRTSSCTSWAVGYYGKTFQEVLEEGWDPTDNAFSPAYLYALQCRNYDRPWNMIKAYETLKNYGIAKWDSMPFDDYTTNAQNKEDEAVDFASVVIPQNAIHEARNYRCGTMASLSNLTQVKQALTKGPVMLSMVYYASPPRAVSPEENYMRPDPNARIGHAITCVGYDDNKFGEGALKFINSWGTQWGEEGFSWIKYSDYPRLIRHALVYKDTQNPDNPNDVPNDVTTRPESPTGVTATDDAGPYVDINWDRVNNARYYIVFRTAVGDVSTHKAIGVARQTNYRDYPTPGVPFYYAIVAVNDLGESQHFSTDTDSKAYVDVGSAVGSALEQPTLEWQSNEGDISNFTVGNIDAGATAMEVMISRASAGPWESLGWIKPDNFHIEFGEDSEFAGKQPWVIVRVANADGYSEPSEAAQVNNKLNSNAEIAKFDRTDRSAQSDKILLRWTTDGGKVDYFETWRYRASDDQSNEWIKLGHSDPGTVDQEGYMYYEDLMAIAGVSYYYVVVPVYQGAYGEIHYWDTPVMLETEQTNLHLASFSYLYGQITSPTVFEEIEIHNEGSVDVEQYSVAIYVYDIENDRRMRIHEVTVTDRLGAMRSHTIRVPDVEIPSQLMDGRHYSWAVIIDYEDIIDELYEDDNTLVSTDVWTLVSNYQALVDNESGLDADPVNQTRSRNSRPFSKKMVVNDIVKALNEDENAEESENTDNGDKDQVVVDEGALTFQKPDFCNDHTK